jgi:hypothetical protein
VVGACSPDLYPRFVNLYSKLVKLLFQYNLDTIWSGCWIMTIWYRSNRSLASTFWFIVGKSGGSTRVRSSTTIPHEGAEEVNDDGGLDRRHHRIPEGDASTDGLSA